MDINFFFGVFQSYSKMKKKMCMFLGDFSVA